MLTIHHQAENTVYLSVYSETGCLSIARRHKLFLKCVFFPFCVPVCLEGGHCTEKDWKRLSEWRVIINKHLFIDKWCYFDHAQHSRNNSTDVLHTTGAQLNDYSQIIQISVHSTYTNNFIFRQYLIIYLGPFSLIYSLWNTAIHCNVQTLSKHCNNHYTV